MRIDVGALAFGTGDPDTDGAYWSCQRLEGWGTPNARLASAPITSRAGTVPTEREWGERTLIVRGTAGGVDDASHDAAWERLHDLAGDLAQAQQLVVRETVPKWLTVHSGGDPRAQMVGGYAFVFELPLIAYRPFKRGMVAHSVHVPAGASVTAPNAGTREAEPVVTTTTDGTVVLPELALATGVSVPPGTVADFTDRTLTAPNGQSIYNAVEPVSTWRGVPKRGGTVTNAGTAAVTLTYYDTWT